MTTCFTETFIQLCERYIPNKTVTIRPHDKIWFDSNIWHEIRRRDRFRSKALKTKSSSDWMKYKRCRNKVNNLKKHAKEAYYNNLENSFLNNYTKSPKQYWKMIREVMKENKIDTVIPPLQMLDSENNPSYVYDDLGKCELLNQYFCSISNIHANDMPLPDSIKRNNNELAGVSISEQDIVDQIQALEVNKAVGHDAISHRMLKGTCNSIAKPLAVIFNFSLETGNFPECWKKADVIPIFKKDDKQLASNYRPISLLSCIGKLFERVIFKYTYNFLHENQIFYNLQSGFLPGHSTEYQLIEMYHSICQNLDNRKNTCVVFCDFSKAFDRVWHRGLLFKLREYGIKGVLLNWFKSYLTNRQQRVLVGSDKSTYMTINAGVPQGSVLGPLLFLIYVNDISNSLTSITRLFADDTSLQHSSDSSDDIEHVVNSDMNKLHQWSNQWLMRFNPKKTDVMLFSTRQNVVKPTILSNNELLPFVQQHRHLGVTLQNNCLWSNHVENIVHSSHRRLNLLRSLKHKLNRNTLSNIYTTYIRPVLEYASVVWDECGVANTYKIERVQLDAARIVTGLPSYSSSADLYAETGWETLKSRRHRFKLKTFNKLMKGETPNYLSCLLPPQVGQTTNYPLRNQTDYVLPNCRLSLFKNSFIPSTIRLWNSLPVEQKYINSIDLRAKPAHQKRLCFGPRALDILQTKLRNNCSVLNQHLYRVGLAESPHCICGSDETTHHFLFDCHLHIVPRQKMLTDLRGYTLTSELLLFGSDELHAEENFVLFKSLQTYLQETGRFS